MKRKAVLYLLSALFLFSCRREASLFTALPASETGIQFVNEQEQRSNLNIISYLYYYNGGGVSIGDVNNDGLSDLFFTANSKGNNKLYLNKGYFKFEDVTEKAGVGGTSDWCTGTTMADINGDGYLDIYVSAVSNTLGLKGANQLYLNNGVSADGQVSFTESAALYGLNFSGLSTQAAFFDFDHDGDLDCYLLNHSQSQVGNIPDAEGRLVPGGISGDRFFRNDRNGGEGKFTEITSQAGIHKSDLGFGLGLAVADFNNDGWDDVYVGNDFFENDYYYINNGNGTFTESGAKHFRHYSRFSMGNDVGDYNNDGQPDLITVDMLPDDEKVLKTYGSDENPDTYRMKLQHHGFQHQYSKNSLQQNNFNGSSFSERSLMSGVAATDWSWCPLFADFDNDGKKDLFITSGIAKRPMDLDYIHFFNRARSGEHGNDQQTLDKMPDGSAHPYIFRGDGTGGFQDVSELWGTGKMEGYFNGAAYADLDNDGDLDIVVNSLGAPAVVLQNNTPKKNELSISFRGSGPNTYGIGAKAYAFSKGTLQYQQLMLTRGFMSSSDKRLHFGLNSTDVLDSVLVVWPDQKYQLIRNVKANQPLVVFQQHASGVFSYTQFFPNEATLFNNITHEIPVKWQHQENQFNDFNVQYLIPHAQSTRGPKIALGDVNGDGLDDFYACGAKEQPGMMMVQQRSGAFVPVDTAVFKTDARCEDVDAAFFDANGDGFLDLYVVSGGNEYQDNSPMLLDRLYLNDGKGHFAKSIGALPSLFENKSCIAVADIDNDKDLDVFIGNLANSRAYGMPQTSYLLLNDGNAHFSLAGEQIIPLTNIGMVTSGVFADINKDGWNDLIVAGEWMPITILINNNGRFTSSALEGTSGWWQTLFVDDVNNDGKLDILAGNWGWNNKFWSGKNGPVRLYVSDFDQNGSTDQLLSYTRNGKEYPFLAKDEIERALPALRKRYQLYAQYAGEVMEKVFDGYAQKVDPLQAEYLGSAVCWGDGNGNFSIDALPAALQMAPVFSFQKAAPKSNESNQYLCGGNFFDVTPYEGRYDAQPLAMFSCRANGNIEPIPQANLASLQQQVRDLKWLNTARFGHLLVVAGNNEKLMFFKQQ